ncbi:N-acetyltransferase family protein [Exiguobacterium sp. NPDC077395]|uniref:GNAT family N-acetyltransferase n=1 Tax=Exiguobacterium sp. NPDC077395 TaxID=3390563 RepID=UPI003D0693B1
MWQGKVKDLLFQVRVLTLSDLPELLSIQEAVIQALAEPEHYQSLSIEEFTKLLADQTLIGATAEGRLIAFRAMLIPPIDDEHLGRDIGWPEASLERVLYQEVTNVHPDFRGFGLQTHLGKLLMSQVEADDRFDVVCATVAPFNIPSMKDKFMLGLRIGALKEKYGGKLRYIFYKELHRSWQPTSEVVDVPMEERARQVKLLQDGWFGTGLMKQGEQWVVRYEK